MSMAHCNTHPYPSQYVCVFDLKNTGAYVPRMLREILKALMEDAGDDAYSIEEKTANNGEKVPQPTTHRFLSGQHGEPRSSTVRKWASVYGLTESQLRGDTPLPAKYAHLGFAYTNDKGTSAGKQQSFAEAIRQEAKQNPYALLEQALASLLIVGTNKDEVLALVKSKARNAAETVQAALSMPDAAADYSQHYQLRDAGVKRHAKIIHPAQQPPSKAKHKKPA